MKNILVFITHSTLGEDHADMCFKSLSLSENPLLFNILIIYNTHKEELSNDFLLSLVQKYDIRKICREIFILEYDESTPKTLGHDCVTIFNFLLNNYSRDDRVLLLKSDILVSSLFLSELRELQSSLGDSFILTPPFITAKKRVTNEELIKYRSKKGIVLSDEETFFDEDCDGGETDHHKRDPLDEKIKFISCTGKSDFSLHYMPLHLSPAITLEDKSWGGVNFDSCKNFWRSTQKSFSLHKYHSVFSKNRLQEREGPIENYFQS